MITWMQKHKKWLVITIWISTIAFVGAGFVGWGSYDFGKSAGSVAVVGDRKVSYEEYQNEYSNLYQQYAQVFGAQFNQEMAKQLKLSDLAYKMVIEKNLILSFGDDLGLDVTDEEIAQELVKIPAFIKNGKFDKNTYIKVLQQNRTNAKDFEASLKRNILLQKIEQLFKVNIQNNEIKNLSQLLFAQDEIAIKIFDKANIKVSIDEAALKAYWEKNKNNYMSSDSYSLEITKEPVVSVSHDEKDLKAHFDKFKNDFKKEDGKLKTFDEAKAEIALALDKKSAKTKALKKYLKLKKGQDKFKNSSVIYEDKMKFSQEDIQKITQAKEGTVLKPFEYNNEFYIVKLVKKFFPKTLSYEDAKVKVTADFTQAKKQEKLDAQVNAALKDFQGTNIGYVSRDTLNGVPGLDQQESAQFLNQLFASKDKKGQITLANKVVVYDIINSKLGQYDSKKDEVVKSMIKQLQNSELMVNLVKRLETKYEIQSSQTNNEAK